MIPRTVRGAGMALALAGTDDEGRADAAKLAGRARRAPARGSRFAPPVRAVALDLTDDVEADVPVLDTLRAQADAARGRVAMLRASAELALYAAQVAAMLADGDALEGDGDAADVVEALTLAGALARKAGAL